MPTIINPYAAPTSIAENLRSLGNSMFGNQSLRELVRQQALAKERENENAEPFAQAAQSGDRNAMAYYGALGNKTGQDVANFGLFGAANHATGVDDPSLATAQIGAHEPMSSTAVGQGRDLAERTQVANIQAETQAATQRAIAERQIEQQQWTDQHTLVTLQDANGNNQMVPKSQVADLQSQGWRVAPTLDNVKAGLISGAGGPQAPQTTANANPSAPQTASTTPQSPAPTPTAPRLSTLTPDQRSIVGLPTNIQSYQHPATGEIATSQDGGLTAKRSDGSQFQLQGSGFMPVDNKDALATVQANVRASQAGNTPPPANPANSQAAADARKASGLDAFAQEHANSTFGSIPGVAPVLKYALGNTGEIGGDYERARSRQDIRNNEARTALLASPGRQSTQQQKWVNELLPEDSALTNPATEAGKIPTIVGALQADLDNERRIMSDPTNPPADRIAANVRSQKLLHAIQMFTAPAPENLPPQSQPGSAPQASQQNQQPPVQGARKAPDGNWYVNDPKRPGKYLQVVQ